jgi:AraC-like DNA-binding protein
MEAGAQGPSESDTDEIRSYLLDAYTSSPYIESIYVYYAAGNQVQSALIGPTKLENTDDQEWLPYYRSMSRTEGKWFVRRYPKAVPSNNTLQTQVTLIRTTPWVGRPVKGAIIVNMNQQVLFQNPSFRLMRPGEEIWMVSPDGSLAFNSNTGLEVPGSEFDAIRGKLGSDNTAFVRQLRGSGYSFTAVTSPYTGWKYVDLIPVASLHKSGKEIQKFMLLLVTLAIVLAALFSFFVAIRIYSPIYSLIQMVSRKKEQWGEGAYARGQSELSMLFSAFQALEEHGAEMEHQLKENWPVLQQSFLQSLILEKSRHHDDRLAKFAYYGLPVTPHGFFVCVLRIDDYAAYVEKYSRYDQSLLRYFIAKLSAESVGAAFRVYPLHTESRDVILIFNPEEELPQERCRELAVEAARRIGSLVGDYSHLTVSAGIGERKEQAGDIADSYREAVEALENRAFQGHGLVAPIWLYRDKKTSDYLLIRRLGELRRDIVLLMRDEHPEQLEAELHKLGDTAESAGGLPFPLIQHAYFQLVVEVFQRMSELGLPPNSDEELAQMQANMTRLETVGEVVHFTQEYIRQMNRRFVSEKAGGGEAASVAQQMMAYIEVNFDKDISLNGIADRLRLDPSYVSRLFRQEISVTFIDYVISLRLAKARELLKTSPLSIKEIGVAVGYENQRSFNRIFKKYEGLTPGEYRDIHALNKLNSNEIY